MGISRRNLNMMVSGLGLAAMSGLPFVAGDALGQTQSDADMAFSNLAIIWFGGAMRLGPVAATQIGDHRYDNVIDDMSAGGRARNLAFCKDILLRLSRIRKDRLSRANQVDYAILENAMRQQVWQIEKAREWAWNPLVYQNTAGSALYNLLARDFAPITTKINSAIARMRLIPNVFAQARSELQPHRVPQPHAETYSLQNAGLKSIITDMILPHRSKLNRAKQIELDQTIKTYFAAIDAHQKWIDNSLVPNARGNFRVGPKIFDEGLGFTLMSDLSRADIKAKALYHVDKIRAQMYAISKKVLDAKLGATPLPANPSAEILQKSIQAALDIAAEDHPPRDKLVETATNMVEVARKFVIEKDLISLPNGPVLVILMPEFQRGYAGAYCDSPGPLETHLPTFYAVSPVPDDWNEAQVKSYLREENNRNIQDIGVHEAMPGHYVQIYHSNKYKSILRAILGSGSFVEGWAVYAEQLMVDEGFKADDPLYELSQLKVQLRSVTNALIDQAIHCDNMSQADCIKFLTETAFQEERAAAGKWRRAQISYNQLSTYFVGFLEHLNAKAAAQTHFGAKFDKKSYHDGILSFGAPPVRFAKQLLLDLPIT